MVWWNPRYAYYIGLKKQLFLESNNLILDSFCNAGCYIQLNPHRSLSDTRGRPDNRL